MTKNQLETCRRELTLALLSAIEHTSGGTSNAILERQGKAAKDYGDPIILREDKYNNWSWIQYL